MRANAILIIMFLWSLVAAAQEAPTYESRRYARDFATGLLNQVADAALLEAEPRVSVDASTANIPRRFSLRGRTGQIEDQGSCGSCWAFGLTSGLRGTLKAAGRDPGRLSFNYLLNCASEQYGCGGGYLSAARHLLRPKGAPRNGTDGPYTGVEGSCRPGTPAGSASSYHMLGSFLSGPSFRDIAYVLAVGRRPVVVTVAVDDAWSSYGSGTFNGCNTSGRRSTNHIVVIEGYDCESSVDAQGNCEFNSSGNLPAGVGTWVVRNSWGSNWGEDGYMVTRATSRTGSRCSAIGSQALYFEL